MAVLDAAAWGGPERDDEDGREGFLGGDGRDPVEEDEEEEDGVHLADEEEEEVVHYPVSVGDEDYDADVETGGAGRRGRRGRPDEGEGGDDGGDCEGDACGDEEEVEIRGGREEEVRADVQLGGDGVPVVGGETCGQSAEVEAVVVVFECRGEQWRLGRRGQTDKRTDIHES